MQVRDHDRVDARVVARLAQLPEARRCRSRAGHRCPLARPGSRCRRRPRPAHDGRLDPATVMRTRATLSGGRVYACSAACSCALGNAQAAWRRRSWRNTKRICCGGRSPSGGPGGRSGRLVAVSAHSTLRLKKQSSQVTFCPTFCCATTRLPFTTASQDGRQESHTGQATCNGAFPQIARIRRRSRKYPRNDAKTPSSGSSDPASSAPSASVRVGGDGPRTVRRCGSSSPASRGYVGAALVPRLRRDGHAVRGFARSPARVAAAGSRSTTSWSATPDRRGARRGAGRDRRRLLPDPLDGGRRARGALRRARAPRGRALRRRGARAPACGGSSTSAGSCPQDAPLSRHSPRRLAVEEGLLAAAPEAIALRASIVIGARSRSFRFLVRLIERLPGARAAGLARAPHRADRRPRRDGVPRRRRDRACALPGRSWDIAGPEVMTYARLIERIADAMLVAGPRLSLGSR